MQRVNTRSTRASNVLVQIILIENLKHFIFPLIEKLSIKNRHSTSKTPQSRHIHLPPKVFKPRQWKPGSDTNWKDQEEGSRGGWLDHQQVKVAIFKFFKLRWSFSTSLSIHNTFQASMARVWVVERLKHANCKKVKGWDWSVQTQWRHGDFWRVSDRWCYRTSTLVQTSTLNGNGCASPRRAPPMKGPRRSNLVYPTMAIAHEGLASLG